MGRITEKVMVQNFGDILRLKEKLIPEDKVRTVGVEAVVDTGAAYLCLPPAIIEKLGLLHSHSRSVQTANGNVKRRIFAGATISIQGREVQMEVMENDATTPSLIGYLVLEHMDLTVDLKSQRIVGNPEHDGKWIMDLY